MAPRRRSIDTSRPARSTTSRAGHHPRAVRGGRHRPLAQVPAVADGALAPSVWEPSRPETLSLLRRATQGGEVAHTHDGQRASEQGSPFLGHNSKDYS